MGLPIASPGFQRRLDFLTPQGQIAPKHNRLEEVGDFYSTTYEGSHGETEHLEDIESEDSDWPASPLAVSRAILRPRSESTNKHTTPPSPRPTQSEFSGKGKERLYDGWSPESPRPEPAMMFSPRLEEEMDDLPYESNEEPSPLTSPEMLPNKGKGKARATDSDDDKSPAWTIPDDKPVANPAQFWSPALADDEDMDLILALEASRLENFAPAEQQGEATGSLSSNVAGPKLNSDDKDELQAWKTDEECYANLLWSMARPSQSEIYPKATKLPDKQDRSLGKQSMRGHDSVQVRFSSIAK